MRKSGILLFVFFIISLAVSSQEYRDVSYWLDGIDLPSDNVSPIYLKNYEAESFPVTLSSLSFDNKLIDIPQIKPLSYTNFFKQHDNWKPLKNLSFENKRNNYYQHPMPQLRNTRNIDLRLNYKLSNRLSVEFSGYYISNNQKSFTITKNQLYQSEIAANLSYNLTKNLKIRTGMQYAYNVATGRWEYMYMTGIVLNF